MAWLLKKPPPSLLKINPFFSQCGISTLTALSDDVAADDAHFGSLGLEHAARAAGLGDDGAGSDDRFRPDAHPVMEAAIDPEEGIGAYSAPARDDGVRGDEDVVFNDRVVTEMISRPHGDVIADGGEWLDNVVFQD